MASVKMSGIYACMSVGIELFNIVAQSLAFGIGRVSPTPGSFGPPTNTKRASVQSFGNADKISANGYE
jgi:hypothetical protein